MAEGGAYRYVQNAMTSNGRQRQFQLVTEQGVHVLESWGEYKTRGDLGW